MSIHERPAEIKKQLVDKHWEEDIIKTSVGTMIECTTRFTVLTKMDAASAAFAVKSFGLILNFFKAQKRLSITYDQGNEMAGHKQLAADTGIKVSLLLHTARGSAEEMRTAMG